MNKSTFNLSICLVAVMLMVSSTNLFSQTREHPKPTIKNISELDLDTKLTPTLQNRDDERAELIAAAKAKLEERQASGHTINRRGDKLNNQNSDRKGVKSNPKITFTERPNITLKQPNYVRDVEEVKEKRKARIAEVIKNLGKN